VPLSHPPPVNLHELPVLISAGRFDPIANADQVKALRNLLRERGAAVDLVTQESGHELIQADIENGRDWLASAAIA
jgi:predicted esterase